MVCLNIVKISGVMMRIIMLRATLMEVPVVELMSSKLIALNVNVFKVVQVVVQVRVQFKTSRLFFPLSKNPKNYLLRCLLCTYSALGTLKTHKIITFERIDMMNIQTSKVGSLF